MRGCVCVHIYAYLYVCIYTYVYIFVLYICICMYTSCMSQHGTPSPGTDPNSSLCIPRDEHALCLWQVLAVEHRTVNKKKNVLLVSLREYRQFFFSSVPVCTFMSWYIRVDHLLIQIEDADASLYCKEVI